jgi:hypothetical protein
MAMEPLRVPCCRVNGRGEPSGRKRFDDATLRHRSSAIAGSTDTAQLGGKAFQICDFVLDCFPLPVGNVAHLTARWSVLYREAQQIADLVKRESQIAAPENEPQSPDVVRAISTVITRCPLDSRQDPNTLVVPDCDDLHTGLLCQISNAHFLSST